MIWHKFVLNALALWWPAKNRQEIYYRFCHIIMEKVNHRNILRNTIFFGNLLRNPQNADWGRHLVKHGIIGDILLPLYHMEKVNYRNISSNKRHFWNSFVWFVWYAEWEKHLVDLDLWGYRFEFMHLQRGNPDTRWNCFCQSTSKIIHSLFCFSVLQKVNRNVSLHIPYPYNVYPWLITLKTAI